MAIMSTRVALALAVIVGVVAVSGFDTHHDDGYHHDPYAHHDDGLHHHGDGHHHDPHEHYDDDHDHEDSSQGLDVHVHVRRHDLAGEKDGQRLDHGVDTDAHHGPEHYDEHGEWMPGHALHGHDDGHHADHGEHHDPHHDLHHEYDTFPFEHTHHDHDHDHDDDAWMDHLLGHDGHFH